MQDCEGIRIDLGGQEVGERAFRGSAVLTP